MNQVVLEQRLWSGVRLVRVFLLLVDNCLRVGVTLIGGGVLEMGVVGRGAVVIEVDVGLR